MLTKVCSYNNQLIYICRETGQLIIGDKNFYNNQNIENKKNLPSSNLMNEVTDASMLRNHKRSRHLTTLTLNICEECNMKCTYCFADEGTYGNKTECSIMQTETLHELLVQLLDHYPDGIKSFCFFGGEPLLYPDNLFKLANTIVSEYNQRGLRQPVFSINTNGTIMPDRVIEFLNKYRVLTTISIDGLKYYHDKHRIMKNGAGSYDIILNNLEKIKERNFKLTAEVTINQSIVSDYKPGLSKKIVDNLITLGFDDFALLPEDNKLESNVQILDVIDKLFEEYTDVVYKYFLSSDEYLRLPSHIIAKVINILKMKKRKSCGAGNSTMFSNVFGNLYPCQLYYSANSKDYKLSEFEEFVIPNTDHVSECSKCFALFYCSSWCSGSVLNFNGCYDSIIETRCAAERAIQRTLICNLLHTRNSRTEYELLLKRLKQFASTHSYDAYLGT